MLSTARTLFARQGLHGTGINQVLAEGGAPKGSMYFHFPGGKQQLAAEAMEASATEMAAAIKATIEAIDDPPAAVRTMADALGQRLVESQFQEGCPLATVALESASTDVVRDACRDGYRQWLDLITADLHKHGLTTSRAEGLAVLILSSIEGALLLARVQRSTQPLREVADRIAPLVAEEMARA
jgi:TetR/AcrR family transcriptional repressor of lmrAB and yxaGH operons